MLTPRAQAARMGSRRPFVTEETASARAPMAFLRRVQSDARFVLLASEEPLVQEGCSCRSRGTTWGSIPLVLTSLLISAGVVALLAEMPLAVKESAASMASQLQRQRLPIWATPQRHPRSTHSERIPQWNWLQSVGALRFEKSGVDSAAIPPGDAEPVVSSLHGNKVESIRLNRRALFSGMSAATVSLILPDSASAASAADNAPSLTALKMPVGSRAEKFAQNLLPKPLDLPRRSLDRDFAVQLSRNSYAVADELDFMPMDVFQKNFFLVRQNNIEWYKEQVRVPLYDLTAPAYFDFISCCQYATIANGIREGRVTFEELIDANGTTQSIRRDPSLPTSNQALIGVFDARVGERLLTWADDNFPQGWTPSTLQASDLSDAALLDGVTRVDNIFKAENFMIKSAIVPLDGGGGIRWTLTAPANLWSTKVLQRLGVRPVNDFEAKVMLAYLKRCGVTATYDTRVTDVEVIHDFRWNLSG